MNSSTEAVFIDLIQSNEGVIHKVIHLYIDDAEDRRDCFQEIMVQCWKSYGQFKGTSKFTTWLYRVCLNTVLNFKRRTVKTSTLEDQEYQSDPEYDDRSELLYHLIKRLDEVERMIITLHLDGYKNPEIAEITGMKKNHINVKLHRIKNNIIESYKNYADGPL